MVDAGLDACNRVGMEASRPLMDSGGKDLCPWVLGNVYFQTSVMNCQYRSMKKDLGKNSLQDIQSLFIQLIIIFHFVTEDGHCECALCSVPLYPERWRLCLGLRTFIFFTAVILLVP